MGAAFLVALALAAIVLAVFGAGEHGTALALQTTARWSFLLFWPAYAGGALGRLWAAYFAGLARHGRELGLAFAAAQLVHVGLVLWLYQITPPPAHPMTLFWLGVLATYLLALFSLPRLRNALGLRLWRMLRTVALEYIALVFAVDFIVLPLEAGGLSGYPVSYLPFTGMLVGGTALRVAAFMRQT
jgi:hypothetical protein